MIGTDPYNTKGYCVQEKVIDITNKAISSIKISLWQDGNFKNSTDEVINSGRIYFKNLSCFVGYDIADFESTNIRYYLCTDQGL